jgi:hypothetical protein
MNAIVGRVKPPSWRLLPLLNTPTHAYSEISTVTLRP